MEDIIDIIVTETTNTIEITAQPNDEIIDVNIIDNREDITLNVTPTVVEININSLTGNFGILWGEIEGTLSNQTDLQNVLNLKADLVDGKVPSSQLPSYVDDVVEVANYAALPVTGEVGKIYITLDTNFIYRWTGSTYVEIKDSSAVWGAITGTLSNQTDLQNALNAKDAVLTFSSPLSRSTNTVSIPAATTSVNGYLTSTDWTTFNAKQTALNGTGFVKISGTTISYDNSTYLTTSAAASTYLALAGGTLTGALNGTSATFTGDLTLSATNPRLYFTDTDNNPDYFISNTDGTFTVYDVTNSTSRFTIGTTGNGTFGGNLTVGQIIRSGGTSSQFLKADGSVDSSTYLTTASAASTYLPLAGGTLTGAVSGTRLTLSQNSADITLSIGNAGTGRAFSVLGTSYFSTDIQLGYATNAILKTTALGFITSAIAGTDYQAPLSGTGFVKISGSTISYDNSTYALDSAVVKLTGNQSVAGIKTMSNVFKLDDTLQIKNIAQLSNSTGYTGIWAETAAIGFYTGANAIRLLYAGNYNYTMPASDGTLALTSQLSAYLPLAGGTLTGALNGTSALFSGAVRANNPSEGATGEGLIAGQSFKIDGTGTSQKAVMYMVSNVLSDTYASGLTAQYANFAGDKAFGFNLNTSGGFELYVKNTTFNKAITVANTGAATFSSSVTANGGFISVQGAQQNSLWLNQNAGGTTTGFLLGRSYTSTNSQDFFIYDVAAAAPRFVISSSGNVGIGTTAPNAVLEVAGTSANTDFRVSRTVSPSTYFFIKAPGGTPSASTMGVNGTDVMTLNSSGNVAIGTTNAASRFNVRGTDSNSQIEFNNFSTGQNYILSYDRVASAYRDLIITTNGANNALVITSSGNVGIGTTSPTALLTVAGTSDLAWSASTSKLQISRSGTVARLQNYDNGSASSLALQWDGGDITTNASNFIFYGQSSSKIQFYSAYSGSPANVGLALFNTSGTTVIGLNANGGGIYTASLGTGLVYSNGGSLTSTNPSDSRLKKNIKTISYGLADIMKLRPVSYDWKEDNINQGIQFGFIAQEVKEIMPDAIKEFGEETKFLGLEKDAIYATLVNAVQELKAELDTLKNK